MLKLDPAWIIELATMVEPVPVQGEVPVQVNVVDADVADAVLRLARLLDIAEGATASAVGLAVGYESVPQFTREYARLFGLPPARDAAVARSWAKAAA